MPCSTPITEAGDSALTFRLSTVLESIVALLTREWAELLAAASRRESSCLRLVGSLLAGNMYRSHPCIMYSFCSATNTALLSSVHERATRERPSSANRPGPGIVLTTFCTLGLVGPVGKFWAKS